MVGSDCSFIFCRSRLTNTAATRVRSSGLPVSFSMIEASITSCSGVLIGRSDAAAVPDLLHRARLRLLHALDHLLARGAAREPVGLRQQRAFARDVADVAGQHVVLEQPLHDLVGGQALGDGEGVLHHLAFDDGLDHVAQACVAGELVLAVFEFVPRLQHQRAGDEQIGLVDHALALQADRRSRGCRRAGC